MNKLISLLLGSLLLLACSNREQAPEAEGQQCLARARVALMNNDYASAKAQIDTLRNRYPRALHARAEGILLLDSICLAETHSELDSLRRFSETAQLDRIGRDSVDYNLDVLTQKVRFFEKKLSIDKEKR